MCNTLTGIINVPNALPIYVQQMIHHTAFWPRPRPSYAGEGPGIHCMRMCQSDH